MPREVTGEHKIFVDKTLLKERSIWAVPIAAIVLLATLWPLAWSSADDDDFPLSTYPMFSRSAGTEVAIPHVVWFDSEGNRSVVDRGDLGAGEVMQAFESLRIIVRSDDEAQTFCVDVAGRVSDAAVEVQVVTDTFDAVEYFADNRIPSASTVHASCVPGEGG